ncbi:sulfite exporter TauE/SafE family protein [Egbenema bharatensis]|uniref:sulfite exporter TauE/SafE family protein n=1 Tax=Egbenema bharatensis TaxID=3463334 RepID=UPI003A87E8FA
MPISPIALPQLLLLITVFFGTSIISVVTGSTSLITVPVMLQVGIEPRTVLATNMFALLLLSIGGTLPFLKSQRIDRRRLPGLISLTLAGSTLGALLVLVVPATSIAPLISVFMLVIALFSVVNWNAGIKPVSGEPSRIAELTGYAVTFGLGIYSGFFIGGYVTMLTVAYINLFRMSFVEAIGITKLVNIFSCLVAVIIFASQGILDYQLGLILGITMFVGGLIGGQFALRSNDVWLKCIFIVTVMGLALKLILVQINASRQSN